MKNSTSRNKTNTSQPKFLEGEKILCYHGTFIYEAKCLKFEKIRANEYQYFVHYNGWNKNWDEWVPAKRILKFNTENLKKQQQIKTEAKLKAASNAKKQVKQKEDCSSSSSTCSTSDTASSSGEKIQTKTRTKRILQLDQTELEPCENKKICQLDLKADVNDVNEMLVKNPIIKSKIQVPENLRIWLIDDFDFIIQQNRIVSLPSKKSITSVLNDYMDYKLNKKYLDDWEHIDEIKIKEDEKYANCLVETVNGLIRYFNIMIGSQLLYKFERLQYAEMLKLNRPMSEIYGPVHFVRLVEKLNQILLNSCPVEEESLESLTYYINDILVYFDKNQANLFNQNDYITVPPFYIRATI